MNTSPLATLALAAACLLLGGCDPSGPTDEPPLELGVFEAQVSGDVTESIQGEAAFQVDTGYSGDSPHLHLHLGAPAKPGGGSHSFRFVYNNTLPGVGSYRISEPRDPHDPGEFGGNYWHSVYGSSNMTGGGVRIWASSETGLEGSFEFTARLRDRAPDGEIEERVVRVTGRFHAEGREDLVDH